MGYTDKQINDFRSAAIDGGGKQLIEKFGFDGEVEEGGTYEIERESVTVYYEDGALDGIDANDVWYYPGELKLDVNVAEIMEAAGIEPAA